MMRLVPNTHKLLGNLRRQCVRMMATYIDGDSNSSNTLESDGPRRPERGMNRVTLVGRVGREPDHRGTDEHPCVVFPLATNLNYRKSSGELMTKTDWHRVCVFRPGIRDNVASRLGKGDRVFVEGSISYTRYTDDDNRSISLTSVVADDIMILARRMNHQIQADGDLD